MSKRNKVNPGQYTQSGRLSPDDAAREQRRTAPPQGADRRDINRMAERDTRSSSKSGSRSGAQKAAASKYVDRSQPASAKIGGAFGRERGKSR